MQLYRVKRMQCGEETYSAQIMAETPREAIERCMHYDDAINHPVWSDTGDRCYVEYSASYWTAKRA